MDLIKTIDENADVEDFSEDSDAEVEVSNRVYCRCVYFVSKCALY